MQELHNDVDVLLVLLDRVKFDDVRVVNLLHDVDLVLQSQLVLSVQLASDRRSKFELTLI